MAELRIWGLLPGDTIVVHNDFSEKLEDQTVPNIGPKLGLKMDVPAHVKEVIIRVHNPKMLYVKKTVRVVHNNMVNTVTLDRIPNPDYDPSSHTSCPEMAALEHQLDRLINKG
jgi:hypothetical protein